MTRFDIKRAILTHMKLLHLKLIKLMTGSERSYLRLRMRYLYLAFLFQVDMKWSVVGVNLSSHPPHSKPDSLVLDKDPIEEENIGVDNFFKLKSGPKNILDVLNVHSDHEGAHLSLPQRRKKHLGLTFWRIRG